MASFPQVNGYKHSWAGIKIKKGPEDIFGFRKIAYKQSRERSKVFGHGIQALGRTRGKHDCEGSMTLLLEQWEDFKAALGDGYMDKSFDLVVQREEIGNDRIFSDQLIGVMIDEVPYDDSEGSDASEVELTLNILRIVEDGVKAIDGELE